MYWIENRGIANGIYMMYYVEDMDSIMFLQDQEEAFWLMAIFDIDMMFTADYEQGFVYEFALAEDGSIGDTTELISVQEPRCIAYFYGLDKSEGKVSGSGAGQASIALHRLLLWPGQVGGQGLGLGRWPGVDRAASPTSMAWTSRRARSRARALARRRSRCIAYFYGLDKSEGKVSGSGAGQA